MTAAPSPSSTELTIVVRDGEEETTSRLTCDPAGGTHPDPERACRVLDTHGAQALPPTPQDQACTEIYGGPQKATISGTWQGRPVQSSLSRENGCEINRWDLLRGLLPPGGV